NNEKWFFKVFRDKYLLNKIFNFIHTYEWIMVDPHARIQYSNKKKFKDIDSLQWMLEKKQFPLIKCKLEAGEIIFNDIKA
ncbi:hypothetical protein DICPUDRAFT_24144, partial [Dictyostelium purpureum]